MPFSPLDLIFPPRCVHCGAYLGHGRALCFDCRKMIAMHDVFFCGKCRARRYSPSGLCHKSFPFLLAAAGESEDPIIGKLVRSLKFHFVRDAAFELGAILFAYSRRIKIPQYDAVMPMPLEKKERRKRGFNQSELIAESFSKRSGIPMELGGSPAKRKIILVNDEISSGSDILETSYSLRRAGAKDILALVVSKA